MAAAVAGLVYRDSDDFHVNYASMGHDPSAVRARSRDGDELACCRRQELGVDPDWDSNLALGGLDGDGGISRLAES